MLMKNFDVTVVYTCLASIAQIAHV